MGQPPKSTEGVVCDRLAPDVNLLHNSIASRSRSSVLEQKRQSMKLKNRVIIVRRLVEKGADGAAAKVVGMGERS